MIIYHITEISAWEKAKIVGTYLPEAFASDGFIHCSLETQVLGVANRFYSTSTALLLLKIDSTLLTSPLVFENLEGNVDLFPHVYGALPLKAVIGALPLVKDELGYYVLPKFS